MFQINRNKMKKTLLRIFGLYLIFLLLNTISGNTLLIAQGTRGNLYVTNGSVNSTLRVNDRLFIAGNFDKIGPRTGSFALVHSNQNVLVRMYPKIKGSVWTLESDGQDGWYLGGDFYVEKSNRRHLIHVNPDGSLDESFNPNVNDGVTYIYKHNNKLYISGFFTEVNASNRLAFACVDASTGVVDAMNIPLDSYANWMQVHGNYMYVGGTFTDVSTLPYQYLFRINLTTNALDTWNMELNEAVNCLKVYDNKLYIAGFFSQVKNTIVDRIAAIDLSNDSVINTGISIQGFGISSMDIYNNALYFGGYFDSVNLMPRKNLACYDLLNKQITSWDPSLKGNSNFIKVHNDNIVVGGVFDSVGNLERKNLTAIDPFTGIATSWNPSPDKFVFAIGANDQGIAVGGLFTSIVRKDVKNLAVVNYQTGIAENWSININGDIATMVNDANKLIISGSFDTVENQLRRSVAAFNLADLSLSNWDIQLTDTFSYISTMLIHNNALFIAGGFEGIGTSNVRNIAKINLSTAAVENWNIDLIGFVNQIKVYNNRLYIAGDFSEIEGVNQAHIARVDLNTNEYDVNWTPSVNAGVLGVDFYKNLIFIYGWFNEVNGSFEQGITAVKELDASLEGQNLLLDGIVTSTAIKDDILYIAGSFFTFGGSIRYNLGAFNIANQEVATWPYETDFPVNYLYMQDDYLYACGMFESVMNEAHTGIVGLPYIGSTVGVEPKNSNKVKTAVYPNPFKQAITIALDKEYSNLSIEVLSLSGQLVYNEKNYELSNKNITLNLSELKSNQLYIISIYSNNKKVYSSKIYKD